MSNQPPHALRVKFPLQHGQELAEPQRRRRPMIGSPISAAEGVRLAILADAIAAREAGDKHGESALWKALEHFGTKRPDDVEAYVPTPLVVASLEQTEVVGNPLPPAPVVEKPEEEKPATGLLAKEIAAAKTVKLRKALLKLQEEDKPDSVKLAQAAALIAQ